jgi:hypothetical protein
MKRAGKGRRDRDGDDFRADERQMLEEIYAELREESGAVTFAAMERFFEWNELFHYFYNVYPHRLSGLLKEGARRFEDRLTKTEFFDFFLNDRRTVAEFQVATQKDVGHLCVLP